MTVAIAPPNRLVRGFASSMPLHIQTPLIESRPLSSITGRQIWLKMESSQPTGSFKLRGIGAVCEHYVRVGKQRFIASSGGNAGIAVAYAGRHLSVPVVVVVPKTTAAIARQMIERENAQLIVHGPSWQEANEFALSMIGPVDAFVHPFDNPILWKGYAGMIDEVAAAAPKPDAVVVAVGGGGLLAGVVEGLRRNGWPDVPVIAVETFGASSLTQSVAAGKRISLATIDTVAVCLGVKQVCEQCFELTTTHPVRCVTVSDESAVGACERFLDDHRVLVEPACGASLSLAYDRVPELERYSRVLMIVCGGSGATAHQLRKWSAELRSAGAKKL
jgi:L-serine/L-threonine ammonia-lyase